MACYEITLACPCYEANIWNFLANSLQGFRNKTIPALRKQRNMYSGPWNQEGYGGACQKPSCGDEKLLLDWLLVNLYMNFNVIKNRWLCKRLVLNSLNISFLHDVIEMGGVIGTLLVDSGTLLPHREFHLYWRYREFHISIDGNSRC